MFFPRKAQVTISILLIFLILFSTFSLGIYGAREIISTTNFRNAVDAAALTAGADLAKGIGLYITITGIRLLVFGASIIVAIFTMFFPSAAEGAIEIEKTLPKISHALEYISRYIPVIYTTIAEIDAYKTFEKNLKDNVESTTGVHLVVIPKAFIDEAIKKVSNKEEISSIKDMFPVFKYDESPSLEQVIKSIDILRSGFIIFAYKEKTFLKQGYENIMNVFGVKNSNTEDQIKEFLNNNEFALLEVHPIKRTNTGVDLSDAVMINKFLLNYENPEGNINRRIEQETGKIKKDVQKIECEYFVGSIQSFLATTGDKIDALGTDSNNTWNNLKGSIDNTIGYLKSCCSSYNNNCDCSNNCFDFDSVASNLKSDLTYTFNYITNTDVSGIQRAKNSINTLTRALQQSICGGEQVDLNRDDYKDFRNLIVEISNYSLDAIKKLEALKEKLPSNGYACRDYITTIDEKGNEKTICSNKCSYNFSESNNIIGSLISNFWEIYSKAKICVDKIDSGAKQIENTIESGFGDIVNDLAGDLRDFATSFKGFPGGNILSFFANAGKFNCECDDSFTIVEEINVCESLSEVGKAGGKLANFLCAVIMDYQIIQKIVKGEKYDFVSYYSPVLDEPDWLKNYTSVQLKIKEDSTLGDVLYSFLDPVKEKLQKESEIKISSMKETIITGLVSAVLGFFTQGPVGVIASLVVTVVGKLVEKALVKITNKVIDWVVEAIAKQFDNLQIWRYINEAFWKFVDNFNYFTAQPLRLLGRNNVNTTSLTKQRNFYWFFCALNDKVVYNDKLAFEAD